MAQDIKKIIAQEYIKCAKDPAYFMRKYCHILKKQNTMKFITMNTMVKMVH